MSNLLENEESVLTSPPSREDEDPIQFKSTLILLSSIVVAYMYLLYLEEKKKVISVEEPKRDEEEERKGIDFFSLLTKSLFVLSFSLTILAISLISGGDDYKNTRISILNLQIYCIYATIISMMFDIYRFNPSMFLSMAYLFGVSISISWGFHFFYEQVNYEPKTIKPNSTVDDDWSQEVLNKEQRRLKDRKDQNNLEWLKWLADNFSDM